MKFSWQFGLISIHFDVHLDDNRLQSVTCNPLPRIILKPQKVWWNLAWQIWQMQNSSNCVKLSTFWIRTHATHEALNYRICKAPPTGVQIYLLGIGWYPLTVTKQMTFIKRSALQFFSQSKIFLWIASTTEIQRFKWLRIYVVIQTVNNSLWWVQCTHRIGMNNHGRSLVEMFKNHLLWPCTILSRRQAAQVRRSRTCIGSNPPKVGDRLNSYQFHMQFATIK